MMTSANPAPSTTSHFAPVSLLKDPAFRAKLQQDPVAAFAEHGIHVDAPKQICLPDLTDWAESGDDKIAGQNWRIFLG